MDKKQLAFYKKLYLIRRTEEKIREHYMEDEMKTPVHLSLGEEAIVVGICEALRPQDQIFGTYRSHGIYLARTGETDAFFAELYGKESGLGKGKVGSMHLCAPEAGLMGTSAIVGGGIPVAVGAAYANKRKGNGKIVAVFFGDGAVDEGVFWESLNVACLMKLPIIFICEDNGYAVHTPKSVRQGYDSIVNIVKQFNCNVFESDSTDVSNIYEEACSIVDLMLNQNGPCFFYTKYYRYLEHVGVNEDYDCGYRTKDEFNKWFERDPIIQQRCRLLKLGVPEDEVIKIEQDINEQINKSVLLAQKAPFPNSDELHMEIYA